MSLKITGKSNGKRRSAGSFFDPVAIIAIGPVARRVCQMVGGKRGRESPSHGLDAGVRARTHVRGDERGGGKGRRSCRRHPSAWAFTHGGNGGKGESSSTSTCSAAYPLGRGQREGPGMRIGPRPITRFPFATALIVAKKKKKIKKKDASSIPPRLPEVISISSVATVAP